MKSSEAMIQLKKFEAAEKAKKVTQIEDMISHFEKMARGLSEQIKKEQEQTGISDVNHFAYSTFAKAAHERRKNILSSISDLKQRLEPSRDELTAAMEQVKKYDMIQEHILDKKSAHRQINHASYNLGGLR